MIYRIYYQEINFWRGDCGRDLIQSPDDANFLEASSEQELLNKIQELIQQYANKASKKIMDQYNLESLEFNLNERYLRYPNYIPDFEGNGLNFISPIVQYDETIAQLNFNNNYILETRIKISNAIQNEKEKLAKKKESDKLLKEAKEAQKKEADYQTYLALRKKYGD
jgi:hypothetical protein